MADVLRAWGGLRGCSLWGQSLPNLRQAGEGWGHRQGSGFAFCFPPLHKGEGWRTLCPFPCRMEK